ncbi:hypothetical protein GUJ93_ZPchr1006g28973 [Zizania palustris]|uniref:Uncharacterized protein n=1 Tax=Zizania palustris TaxID=103762 RepID=A0A8J5RD70_ZIZPA|nr:hypothetical protein GUJ93_ZPchr1006g28973 [Zizania palustris]
MEVLHVLSCFSGGRPVLGGAPREVEGEAARGGLRRAGEAACPICLRRPVGDGAEFGDSAEPHPASGFEGFMKMDKEMQQVECGDEPSPHVEGDSQPGANVAVLDEAKALEEEKSVEGEGSMEDDADNVNSAKDAAKPKGVDAEEETGSQLGVPAVDPANKANGISVTSKGKKDAGENEVAEMEVEKLENGMGMQRSQTVRRAASPKVEGDSDGDNNDVNGEKQLLLASAGEDEDPVLSKLASSSFMFGLQLWW